MRPADPSDPKVAAVVDAARRAGVTIEPVTFTGHTKTSADAAREIGCPVERICKSLVFDADGEPVLLLLSGADRVDLHKAAEAVGVAELHRADPTVAKQHTGFSIGGTPPFGHIDQLPVLVDEALLAFETVWAGGGRGDTVFEISPEDLLRVSGGRRAQLRDV